MNFDDSFTYGIAKLKSLEYLDLSKTQRNDCLPMTNLYPLKALTNLQWLNLAQTGGTIKLS
jgi:hypothetical protein